MNGANGNTTKRCEMNEKIAEWYQKYIPAEIYQASAFKFNVKLSNAQSVVINIPAMTNIDYESLEEDMADIPSELSYYGVIHSELKYAIAVIDRKIKARRGILTEQSMDVLNKERLKLTEFQLKNIIESDEVLNELELLLAKTWRDAGKMYYMVDTLKAKLDVARSLAGFKKQDRSSER